MFHGILVEKDLIIPSSFLIGMTATMLGFQPGR